MWENTLYALFFAYFREKVIKKRLTFCYWRSANIPSE